MSEKKQIKILPGGPYEVDAELPLKQAVIQVDKHGTSERWADGKTYTDHPGGADAPYHLCRCGHSKNKPYCDGSHAAAGFKGAETNDHASYRSGCERYEGEAVDLLDNESLCASMRFCDRGIGVWNAAIESGDEAKKAMAIEEAGCCAAGRLTVVQKDGTPIEPELPQEIGLVEDTTAGRRGPLAVRGGIELVGADGRGYEVRNRMTLCRCGESKNMPFCDISHMMCSHMEGFDE